MKKKVSTSKLLIGFIFINCIVVEIYSMWVMYTLADLSALSVLMTAIIGETFAYAVYSIKSTKENTQGGIVYDLALKDETINKPNEKG